MDNIKDGVITMTDDYIVETCNPAVEKLWGYSSSEIVGRKLDFLINYDCDGVDNVTCFSKKEFLGVKKDGQKFPIEIDISEIKVDDEKINLLTIRDITERIKVDKMKNEFISTVSHELRTPLTAIKGSLELIISGNLGHLPAKISKLIQIADNNCTRLVNLINDILDLEKITAGKYEFRFEILEINSIISQAIILNQPYADLFDIKIKAIKHVEESFVKADKTRLLQVFSNLIANAVKFSNPNGEINITSIIENDKVKVSVEDYGIGIPEEAKDKLFQSFSQVDSSDTRSRGGTGLGLSICKLILENMEGDINFVSEVGKGSTFFFTLPIMDKDSSVD